jgi:hypothetical protein
VMKDTLETIETQEMQSDRDLYLRLFIAPRFVFKYITAKQHDKYVAWLLIVWGAAYVFDTAATSKWGNLMEPWLLIVECILIGALWGWIASNIYASTLRLLGRWFNGAADTKSILRVIAYATIPSSFSLIILAAEFVVYGADLFMASGTAVPRGVAYNYFSQTCWGIDVALGIWSAILCVIGIAELQKISIGKALIYVLVPVVGFYGLLQLAFMLYARCTTCA